MPSNQTQSYFSQSNLWTDQIAPYQEQVLADILAILPSDVTSILDVGCGNGLITNQLPNSIKVVGLDRSEAALKYVQKDTILGDILNLPLEDQSFDLVVCNDVLEHLTDIERQQALRELARVSCKYILITVPFLEDLNQGMTKCADCGKYYHINHHLTSFDLETTRKFFHDFNYHCVRQVLSGDIWYGEPQEIILTRRILLDLSPSENAVCLYCGSQKVISSQDSNDVVEPLIAKLCLNNPALFDWHTRRTECISVFTKENLNFNDHNFDSREVFIDQNNNEVYLASEVIKNNQIVFSKKALYNHKFLPKISRLPYFYTNTGDLNEKGVKLTESQNLLLGFFCKSNHEQNLNLIFSGFAQEESVIVIAKYDNLQGYILPITQTINQQFSINLKFPSVLSSYGFLFEIRVLSGNVLLTDALLESGQFEQIQVYENQTQQARFLRIIGEQYNVIDISLPIYREFIVAQQWQNQIQTKKPHHLEAQKSSNLNNYLSVLSQEIRSKNQLNITIQNQNHQLENSLLNSGQDLQEKNYLITQLQEQNHQLENSLLMLAQEPREKNYLITQLYEKTLTSKIKRKILSFGQSKYYSFEKCKTQILSSIKPDLIDPEWQHLKQNNKLFLMICHDQNIDRRIIQQATALTEIGWKGKIICLSFDNEDHLEEYEGISIHRIGLAKIVPDCPVYWRYQNRQRLINWWGRNFNLLSKINWLYYKIQSRLEYQGKHSGYPLPFDLVFYETATHYPADLVIAHDLPSLKAAHKIAKEWNVLLGYDAHELYYEQNVFSEKKKKFMRQTEQELIKECDVVFTVNLSIAEEMASRYQIPTPNVLLNAIDPPQDFNPQVPSNHLRDYFELTVDQKILLFQGGLERNRNLENIVQSMRYVTASNIVLIFMGNGSLKETLQNLVKKYNLTNKVFFKEAVPQNDLIYWTSSADIGIIPYPHVDLNTYYCTPNKLFEFIQAQLPIIANDSPELRRFVHDSGFGKVGSMKNPHEITKLIDIFVTDSNGFQKNKENLSNNCYNFSWSCEKINYLKQLKTLIPNINNGQNEFINE